MPSSTPSLPPGIPPIPDFEIFTPAEAGLILGVNSRTVERWNRQGKISAFRTPGNIRRYPRAEILRVLTEGFHPAGTSQPSWPGRRDRAGQGGAGPR